MSTQAFDFAHLVTAIEQTHVALADQAAKAVNISLTLRNWLMGYYIREYEQSGADRSAYGERLLETLAQRLQQAGLQRIEARELRRYRQFYLAYRMLGQPDKQEAYGIREKTAPVGAVLLNEI